MEASRQTDVIFTEVIHHGKLLLVDLQVYFFVRREVIFASLGIALFKSTNDILPNRLRNMRELFSNASSPFTWKIAKYSLTKGRGNVKQELPFEVEKVEN